MRDIATDTVIDSRYRVVQRVGSGGMADVYLCEDLQLGRHVAVKLLHRRFSEDEQFVERFRREASAAAGLQHPNVVSVYDRGEWDGTYYIAMEYLQGRTLKQVVQEEAPLDPLRAIDLCEQILRAARFAHKNGIVHRDIKPHNVIVDEEGRVKVTDFGIARASSSDMTETGSIMGTAQYLSPEQAQGRPVSASSDLYSTGVLLYELMTGSVPFDGDSAVAIALKQVSEPPRPPHELNERIPPMLEAVIMRALVKDPEGRFQDADQFIDALETVRADITGAGPTGSTVAFAALPTTPLSALAPPTAAEAVAAGSNGGGGGNTTEQASAGDRKRKWLPWLLGGLAVLVLAGAAVATVLLVGDGDKVTVPAVAGLKLQTATQALANRGLEFRVEKVTNPRKPDTVLSQNPSAGAEAEKGSTVTLIVSQGPGDNDVPDVSGLTRKQAAERVQAAGFTPKFRQEFSDTVAPGKVTRTQPSFGTQLERGSTVTIFLSKGEEPVTVPNVIGKSRDAAEVEIERANLNASVTQEESEEEPGTVIAQNPPAGEPIGKGSTISIVVAKEKTTIDVPDVTGQQQGAAASALSGDGFTVVFRDVETENEDEDGTVLSQSPSAGSAAKKGAKITLTIGNYVPPPDPEPPTP